MLWFFKHKTMIIIIVAYWASHLNCILHPSLPIRLIRLLFTFFVLYLSFLFNSRREKTCFSRNVSHFRHFHLLFRYFIITIFIAIGSNWYTPCNVAYENKCISLSFRRLISIFVQQISTNNNRMWPKKAFDGRGKRGNIKTKCRLGKYLFNNSLNADVFRC